MKTVYFYTKKDCPLCVEGLTLLKELQSLYSFRIVERDIYTNDEWLDLYQIRIPVVVDEKKKVLDEGILSSTVLERGLKKWTE